MNRPFPAWRRELARALLRKGAYSELRCLLLPVFQRDTQVLSDDDIPLFATEMSFLSDAHRALGDLLASIECIKKALDTTKAGNGNQHNNIVLALSENLACLHHEAGQPLEALDIEKAIVTQHLRTLGNAHPLTIESVLELSSTYFDLNHLDLALDAALQAVDGCTHHFGHYHSETYAAKLWLVQLLIQKNERLEALNTLIPMLGRTISGERSRRLTFDIHVSASALYEQQRMWDEAVDCWATAISLGFSLLDLAEVTVIEVGAAIRSQQKCLAALERDAEAKALDLTFENLVFWA